MADDTNPNPAPAADEDLAALGNEVRLLTPEEKAKAEAEKNKTVETPEPTVDEPAVDEPEAELTEYATYEHPALAQAVEIMKTANLPIAEANAIFAAAVETGDMSKVDRKALETKLGKKQADLVMICAENYYNTQFTAFKKIEAAAHELTGGADNYKAMQAWAKKKEATDPAFAADLREYREMLNTQNPKAVKAAVSELFAAFKADPNVTIKPTLHEGTGKSNDQGLAPLSRSEYIDALEKAQRKGTYAQEKPQLWARRQAAMKQGK